jgi:hypothetical protein
MAVSGGDPIASAVSAFREASLVFQEPEITLDGLKSELSKLLPLLQTLQDEEIRLQEVLVTGLDFGTVKTTSQPISDEEQHWKTFTATSDSPYQWKPCDKTLADGVAFNYCMLRLNSDTLLDILDLKKMEETPALAAIATSSASTEATRELPERMQAPSQSMVCLCHLRLICISCGLCLSCLGIQCNRQRTTARQGQEEAQSQGRHTTRCMHVLLPSASTLADRC